MHCQVSQMFVRACCILTTTAAHSDRTLVKVGLYLNVSHKRALGPCLNRSKQSIIISSWQHRSLAKGRHLLLSHQQQPQKPVPHLPSSKRMPFQALISFNIRQWGSHRCRQRTTTTSFPDVRRNFLFVFFELCLHFTVLYTRQ